MRILLFLFLTILPMLLFARSVKPPEKLGGVELLNLKEASSYAGWMQRYGWKDVRPFSDSASRFRLLDGTLRMESQDESFIIAADLASRLSKPISDFPYLRFVVRIGDVPRGAKLAGEEADDAAFRLYTVFNRDPWQALAYVWSWQLPVGDWSSRGRSFWGNFQGIRRKAFGQGEPLPHRWLTVEVDLRRDFRQQWPNQPLPAVRGLALKTDSNDVEGQRSLAWLRSVSLHRQSLKTQGYENWSLYRGTTLWFR